MGVIFYFVNWVFLVLWVAGIIASIVVAVRRSKKTAAVLPPSSDEFEEEETKKSSVNHSYGTKVEVV